MGVAKYWRSSILGGRRNGPTDLMRCRSVYIFEQKGDKFS